MTYGYARCSTDESKQDIDRQKRELKKLGVENDERIFWEYASGTDKTRPELAKLLSLVNEGDCIVTTEVSRLTRSTQHLCEIIRIAQERHLKLVIGSFVVDCSSEEIDPMTKGMLMMWGVFSEMERDIISQRVKSGMANAAAKGKKIGRPGLTRESIPDRFWKFFDLYKRGELTVSDFAKVMGVARGTIYSYINVAEKK